jgi:formiminotetrahydrofolate cyclodeaminase
MKPTPATVTVRGVGALAAGIVAQAGELVAVLARQAGQGASAAQAERIVARASALSVMNEHAFTRASYELDASIGGRGDEFALTQALARAVEVPLGVCEVASDLVLLAADLAEGPLGQHRADVCGAAQLAAGACRTAALLIRVNLTVGAADPRRSQADVVSTAADYTARRMLEELVGA